MCITTELMHSDIVPQLQGDELIEAKNQRTINKKKERDSLESIGIKKYYLESTKKRTINSQFLG